MASPNALIPYQPPYPLMPRAESAVQPGNSARPIQPAHRALGTVYALGSSQAVSTYKPDGTPVSERATGKIIDTYA